MNLKTDNIECIIFCPKLALEKLLEQEILIELPSQYSKYVLERYDYSPIYRSFQLNNLGYRCKVYYIETNPLHPIPYNVNAILQYKFDDNGIKLYLDKNKNKDIKFIYIFNDEIYGYREMIEILFYLGLGHQVIIVNEKLHPHNSFFAYSELTKIRSKLYAKQYLRNERDYFGNLNDFIKYCKNEKNMRLLFETRQNTKDRIYQIKDNEFLEQLKYKYMSYPTFKQKRVDFDAPYCNTQETNLSIDKSCKFTMKPILSLSYNLGHIVRLSNIIEKQFTSMKTSIYMGFNRNSNSNVSNNINTEKNINKLTLNLSNGELGNKTNREINLDYNRYRAYMLGKLDDYFDFLTNIDYIESYNELKQESDESSLKVAFGYNFFCMLRFNYSQLEDHEKMKLDYLDYYIKNKFNLQNTIEELQLVKLIDNTENVDYEYDIQRLISKKIKEIFNSNVSMKERLYKLYEENVEFDNDFDVNIISKRYQINTRLRYLYRFILEEQYEKEESKNKLDVLINQAYIPISDIDDVKKPKFPVFVDQSNPSISYIITDLTKQSDIISQYLEQRKKRNEELQQKLKSDPEFRKNFTRARRIRELKYYYPNLSKENYDKLFEEEQKELKQKEIRGQKKLNKINKAIIEGKIVYIRLSNFFIIDINNNRYNIYLSSVPDRSEIAPYLNQYSFETKIATYNNEPILPVFERKYNSELVIEEGNVFYRKKIYFVRDLPDIDDIIQLPIDIKYYNLKNEELSKIPREIRSEKLAIYSDILKTKIKQHLLEINGYFIINEQKQKKLYLTTRKITKPNIEIYELSQEQVLNIQNLFKRSKYPIHKLFIPNQIYLVNIVPPKNTLLNIPIENENVNSNIIVENIFSNILQQVLHISTNQSIKYYFTDETLEPSNEITEPIQNETILGGQIDRKSSQQSGIIIVENTIEYPLTIIQAFYQFISLTYLMDLFNNVNNGRNFLKLFRDTLYKDEKWKKLYLPETLN
jgi:hypothetical protein